ADGAARRDERLAELAGVGLGGAAQEEGEPGGGLLAQAGQPAQRLHQALDRLRPRLARAPPPSGKGSGTPATPRIASAAISRARASAWLAAARTRSWSISTSRGSTACGSMRTRTSSIAPLAVT